MKNGGSLGEATSEIKTNYINQIKTEYTGIDSLRLNAIKIQLISKEGYLNAKRNQ